MRLIFKRLGEVAGPAQALQIAHKVEAGIRAQRIQSTLLRLAYGFAGRYDVVN
jgi:hypothetical protein